MPVILLRLLPYILVALVAAGIAGGATYKWEHAFVVAAEAERDSATSQLETATADVARWTEAWEKDHAKLEAQNAAIEAQRADLTRANQIIADANEAQRKAAAASQAQIEHWKELARAHPDQTSPIGPIARDALRVLLDQR